MIFTHPAFLWGLLAVLIPIAVHLFNFRRYRKVYFSNVERLSELQTESRRQSRLKQWLVLVARVLAIVFLVLAFARPATAPHPPRAALGGNAVVSLYIDNSFSMESASSDGSQLDMALQKAREIASSYGLDTRFQLMTNAMDGKEMQWLNRDELNDALEAVEPSAASRRMSEVAKRQSDFMRQSGATVRHAYLISDFQQSVSDLEALPADSSALFTLVPLAGVEADNVYIDTLRLDAPAYFTGGSVNVEVTVRNCGAQAVEKVPVKLYIDGRERALATLDLAAGASGTTVLRFSIDRAGWLDGRVEIEDYPVTFDDNYYFTLLAGEPIAMLEVDGSQPNAALRRLFEHDSAVAYHCERHLPPSIDDFHFIALNEVAALASGEVQQLVEWVTAGGSLLVIPPSPDANPQMPNALLSALHAPQLGQWNKRTVRANAIDYENSLYQSAFNGRSDEMEMPTVQGHYSHLAGQAIKSQIITLADGGDLLTVTPCGAGRIYLFTTPLVGEWTDFTAQALFVPTLYNMALYSRPQPMVSHTLGDDSPIALQGSYGANRQPPALTDGGEWSIIPDLWRTGNRQVLMPHGELTAAGIYTLAEEHLAFNHPRQESELQFLTRDEVAKAVEGRAEYTVVRNSQKPLGDELRARDGGRALWRLCVALALLALAAETLLLKLK